MRQLIARALVAVLCWSFASVSNAQATFSTYLDIDGNAANGCTVTLPGGTLSGIDKRIQVTATTGATPGVTGVTLSNCTAGVFGAPVALSGASPVGLNNGTAGSDVVEFSAPLASMFPAGTFQARMGFVGENTGGSDVLFTTNGGPDGGPIVLGLGIPIPMLGLGGLLMLGVLVLVFANRFGRNRLAARVLGASLVLVSGASIAANFIVDGQVGDWTGVNALATDPAGDATNNSAAIDLRAGFAAVENNAIYFRLDVSDLQNQPPVANAQPVTLNEDGTLTITLTATDPEAQPLTFAIGTNPTNGALSGLTQVPPSSATVLYTPTANYFGPDSFTFTANDGQATSAPATVSITVNPVNDAPSFTATNPPAVNEDAGAQTIPNWATFNPGPANEASQTVLAYTVSAVSNAALFSAQPAVANNGTLTYTPAADANGTSTFTVTVQDNGGTTNGGVDTSAPQTFTITVNAVNDPPVLTAGATVGFTENGAALVVDNTITVTDVDSANLAGATAQISAGFQAGADVLACGACGAITANFAGGTLTLSGTATLAAYQAALRSVTFINASENPTPGARTITWIGNDGAAANNLSAPVTSTVNVTAVNDAPTNTVPGTQAVADTATLTFSTGNGNALSTADVDAGTANVQLTLGVPAGSGTLALGSTAGLTVTGNGTNAVTATGPITAINTGLQNTVYTPVVGTSAAITLTMAVNDQGNTPAPALTDTDTVTINVDAAPTVTSTVPANGATTGNAPTLTINFSENIVATAGAVTLTCGGPNLITGGTTGTNVAVLNPTYTAPLPNGATCTLTVLAANITDSDAIDPPNNMAANFVSTFTVDTAPTVTATTPTNGATTANNVALSVTFSEPVNATNAVTLTCGGPNLITGGATGTNVSSLTPTYTAPLPNGTACTMTVLAAAVADADTFDPPDNLAANTVVNFTTDAAPTVTTVTPANGATQVATTAPLTINFSENVNLSATAVTLNCGGAIALTGLPASNVNTVTLTHAGLPQNTACTATVVAAQVADADANDPPDNMAANFVWSFTTDAAPTVVSTVPVNAATSVVPTANLVVTFSEPVNFVAGDFTISCNSTPQTFTIAGNGTATATLTPSGAGLLAGANCVFTVLGAAISDVDLGDPPNFVGGNTVVNFVTQAIANDDTYMATPHLTLGIGTTTPQGGGVLQNDLIGAAVITGFGFAPACTGTAVGAQLDAGAANGRLTLNANGSFSYEPPAAVATATRTFCYTITGGDTANIAFNIQTAELVWFVDGAAAVGGNGTQARPFQTLTAAAGVDTTNDTLFIESGAYTCGITLENGELVVGKGATATLNTITGITPVAGSAFPSTSGVRPTLSVGSGACLTLGTGNLLRGFNINDAGTDIAGTAFGLSIMSEMALSGTGQALDLSNGNVTATFDSIASTSSAAQNLRLNQVVGSMAVTGTTALSGATGTGLDIQNGSATVTFTGATTVTKSVAGAGVNLNAHSGLVSFTALNATTSNGAAVTADTANIDVNAGTISATGGPGVNSTGTNWNTTAFTGVSSSGSGTQGINLNNISGTLNLGTGSLATSAGTAFFGQANLGTTSYAGTISKTNAGKAIVVSGAGNGTLTLSGDITCNGGCTGLDVLNRTGGSNTFSGASKVLNTAASAGVTLTSNTGATIDFTGGGLDIDTTSGTGFNATGGGTISVQGTVNTIDATTGIGLNVANTTVGASNLTFQRVSSGGGANVGISLDNTGTAGGLSITGTGTAGSGGTIANKTGADNSTTSGIGIYLNNTSNVFLARMQLNDFQNSGIVGRSVTNFTLNDSVINGTIGNNSAPVEGAINFGITNPGGTNGLQGTGVIHNTKISGSIEHNVEFYNQSGSMTLTIDGTNAPTVAGGDCEIRDNSVALGSDGMLLEMQGNATATVTVRRCFFNNNKSQPVQVSAIDSSTISSTIDANRVERVAQGNEGFILSNGTNSDLTSYLTANTINNILGAALFTGQVAGNATNATDLIGVIRNNTINTGSAAGPYPTNRSLLVFLTSTVGQVSRANIDVSGNTINTFSDPVNGNAQPIFVSTPDANTSPMFTGTVLNNVVNVNDTAGLAVNGIAAQSTQGNGTTNTNACFDIRGNDVNYIGALPTALGVRVRQAGNGVASLEQGASAGTAAVVIAANNPLSTTEALGTVTVVGNATCQNPPP